MGNAKALKSGTGISIGTTLFCFLIVRDGAGRTLLKQMILHVSLLDLDNLSAGTPDMVVAVQDNSLESVAITVNEKQFESLTELWVKLEESLTPKQFIHVVKCGEPTSQKTFYLKYSGKDYCTYKLQ